METLAEMTSGFIFGGLDGGFGTIKTDTGSSNGPSTLFHMQSTVASGTDRSLSKWESSLQSKNSSQNLREQLLNMDVRITYHSKDDATVHLFLGRLATQEGSDPRFCWEDNKSADDDAIALMVSQLAVAATERSGGVDSSTIFYIGTGLPVKHFAQHKESYEQNIKGKYTVEFCSGPWEGVRAHINIIRCKVYPQVWGIFYDETHDDHGNVINKDLLHGYVLALDPGFRTTDYALFLDGNIVSNFSDSLEDGVMWAMKQISVQLQKEGVHLNEKEIDFYLMEQGGFYRMPDGREIDLKVYRDIAFKQLAKRISNNLKPALEGRWDSIGKILVGGGGGKGMFEDFNFEGKQKVLARNPQFGNASGFKKAVIASLKKTVNNNG